MTHTPLSLRGKLSLVFLSAVGLICTLQGQVSAAEPTGTVTGTVLDSTHGRALDLWGIGANTPNSMKATATNSEGVFTINGLAYGTYTICSASNAEGWVQTTPTTGDTCSDNTKGYMVTLDAEHPTVTVPNFAFAKTADAGLPAVVVDPATPNGLIEGQVYNDKDKNGYFTDGDVGLSGWTVQISGPTSRTLTTNTTGQFSVDGLPAGIYKICEVIPTGWRQTIPGISMGFSTETTSDCGNGINGYTVNFKTNISSNRYIGFSNTDAPLVAPTLPENPAVQMTVTTSGVAGIDANNNGIPDGPDPGLEGWKVVMLGPDPKTTIVDKDGNWSFPKTTGKFANVCLEKRAGFTQVYPKPLPVDQGGSFANLMISPCPAGYMPYGLALSCASCGADQVQAGELNMSGGVFLLKQDASTTTTAATTTPTPTSGQVTPAPASITAQPSVTNVSAPKPTTSTIPKALPKTGEESSMPIEQILAILSISMLVVFVLKNRIRAVVSDR